MPQEPFIDPSQRPDLTIDLESRVGDLSVRQLTDILGGTASIKVKELAKEKGENFKEPLKEQKDFKDHKDQKDHKDPKEHKDSKDQKDQKDPKEQKDQKDQKDSKDQKDPKEQKDQKDPKEHKDQKDQKDHKNETKEHKDVKDLKDRKEALKEPKEPVDKALPESKDPVSEAKGQGSTEGPGGAPVVPSGLEALIQRISRLEQDIAELKKGSTQG